MNRTTQFLFLLLLVMLLVLNVVQVALLIQPSDGPPPEKDSKALTKDGKTPLGLFEQPQPYREPDRLAEVSYAHSVY